jgi:hypothetical protein
MLANDLDDPSYYLVQKNFLPCSRWRQVGDLVSTGPTLALHSYLISPRFSQLKVVFAGVAKVQKLIISSPPFLSSGSTGFALGSHSQPRSNYPFALEACHRLLALSRLRDSLLIPAAQSFRTVQSKASGSCGPYELAKTHCHLKRGSSRTSQTFHTAK